MGPFSGHSRTGKLRRKSSPAAQNDVIAPRGVGARRGRPAPHQPAGPRRPPPASAAARGWAEGAAEAPPRPGPEPEAAPARRLPRRRSRRFPKRRNFEKNKLLGFCIKKNSKKTNPMTCFCTSKKGPGRAEFQTDNVLEGSQKTNSTRLRFRGLTVPFLTNPEGHFHLLRAKMTQNQWIVAKKNTTKKPERSRWLLLVSPADSCQES